MFLLLWNLHKIISEIEIWEIIRSSYVWLDELRNLQRTIATSSLVLVCYTNRILGWHLSATITFG